MSQRCCIKYYSLLCISYSNFAMSCMLLNSGMYSCILLSLVTLRRCRETQLNISVGCTECMGTALLQYNHITSHKKVVVYFQDSYVMYSVQITRIQQSALYLCPYSNYGFNIFIFTTLSPNFRGCLLSSFWHGGEELLLIPHICTPSIDVSSCSWKTDK